MDYLLTDTTGLLRSLFELSNWTITRSTSVCWILSIFNIITETRLNINLDGLVDHISATQASSVYELNNRI